MCFENLELIIFLLKGFFFFLEKVYFLLFCLLLKKKMINIFNIGFGYEFVGKELLIGNYFKDLKDEIL